MKERIEQSHKDEKGLEKFEKKISDLAITIVQSVLVGKGDIKISELSYRLQFFLDFRYEKMSFGNHNNFFQMFQLLTPMKML